MKEEIKRWAGWDVRFDEEIRQIRMKTVREQALVTYPRGTVDIDCFEEAVVLNEHTADYLYTEHTPLELKYKAGSRPFLERIVGMVTTDCRKDRDKVFALLKFIRDIQYTVPLDPSGNWGIKKEPFGGGTEEDIIRKHAGMCNEQARALITLCQIAGFPARYIGNIRMYGPDLQNPSGHGVCEVYLEGKWCYLDIKGCYFLLPGGSVASLWELTQDPEITLRQPDEVYDMLGPNRVLEEVYRNVHPSTISIITNYFVWEHDKHCYQWTWYTDEFRQALIRKTEELTEWVRAQITAKGLETPWRYPSTQTLPDGVVPKKKGSPLSEEDKEVVWRILYPARTKELGR